VADVRGHGGKLSGFIKGRILLDQLNYCQLLENDLLNIVS
jgi:hypothetical protein